MGQGYFVFSLDTELATGYFDLDAERERLFSADGVPERQRINRILRLCETYGVHGTWALVGHLFFESCEFCDPCPLAHWKGKYSSYNQVYGSRHPLWYGADVVKAIQACQVTQEIGFHGHTHSVFAESEMHIDQVKLEIAEWKRLARRHGVEGRSVVFPRDVPGHLALLKDAGFDNYRYDTPAPLLVRNRYFGPYLKTLDHIISLSAAPSFPLRLVEDHGLFRHYSSAHLFAFNRGVDLLLNRMGLGGLRIRRIIRGLRNAAHGGKVFHLWAHPWEFATEDDLAKLEAIFQAAAALTETHGLRSVTMTQLNDIVRKKGDG